jgi:parvulin-like peptidyl-prolyl isomerase
MAVGQTSDEVGRSAHQPPRWWHGRVLHFAVLGAALFGAHTMRATAPPAATALTTRPSITISAAHTALLRRDFELSVGRAPSADEARALIDKAIDEELLYREALALGLDRGDRSVDWRLAEKMRFLTGKEEDEGGDIALQASEARVLGLDRDDPVLRRQLIHKMRLRLRSASDTLDDAALAAYYERHREQYRQPERVSLSHVFFSRADLDATQRAAEMLAGLRAHRAPGPVASLGEPFAGGHSVVAGSRAQVRKRFGASFAEAVFALPTGAWQGPIASAYGLHLVQVHEHQPSRVPELSEVVSQVRRRQAAEVRGSQLVQLLLDLRREYDVRVEPTTSPPA